MRFLVGAGFGLGLLLTLRAAVSLRPLQSLRSVLAQVESNDAQTLWAARIGGAAVVSLLGGAVTSSPSGSVFGLAVGAVAGDRLLRSAIRSRAREAELRQRLLMPQFLDLMTISVGSGLALRAAVAVAVSHAHPAVAEPWLALTRDHTGRRPLAAWLDDIVRSHGPGSRVASQLLIASERGTPLADVLFSLAAELRAESRRELLERAAKKDVQMMLPVVFGILPSITAIAMYPALTTLSALN